MTETKVTKVPCPVCDGYEKVKSRGTKGLIRLLECCRCGFAFADRTYWKDPYHGSDYYEANAEELSALGFSKTDADRLSMLVKRFDNGGMLLDFGGGMGTTAGAANQFGFSCTVVESSRKAIEMGVKRYPKVQWIYSEEIPSDIPDNSYDVVTMFHVLEHVLEPKRLLLQVRRILKGGGLLLIEVPNWASMERRIKGMNWLYLVDHHVNYFSKRTLDRLVEPLGFVSLETQYRRTFAINERQPWKEPLKRILNLLGFANILRSLYSKVSESEQS